MENKNNNLIELQKMTRRMLLQNRDYAELKRRLVIMLWVLNKIILFDKQKNIINKNINKKLCRGK